MKTIGLTGGIGSGKSFVAQLFANHGIICYNCDARAKELNNTHKRIIEQLTERYGTNAYTNGKLNRQLIAQQIFNNKTELQWINNLIHPIVHDDFVEWRSRQTGNFVLIESAILIDSGFSKLCDKVISVEAPLATRIARVMRRDNLTEEQVRQRISSQASDSYRRANADFVITNGEKNDTENQVDMIIAHINGISI